MLRVGLTGGIGTGKTTVADLFAGYGAPIVDADAIAKQLLEPGQAAYQQTIKRFGKDILHDNGHIDRNRLRKRVFDIPQERKHLEAIIHPQVRSEISTTVNKLDALYCIIVIPLLFEAEQEDLVDRVLVVDADRDHQIQRATKRSNLSTDEVTKIIDAQISRQQRLERADDVITNNDNLEQLEQKVEKLHHKYISLTKSTT